MSLYDEKIEREKKVTLGAIIYLFFTCLIYILPYTKFVVPYIIAAIIMLASLLFIVFRRDDCFLTILLLFFLTGLYCILSWATGNILVNSINEGIRNIRFFIPAFWAIYVLRYCTQTQKNIFIGLFILLTIFIVIKTFIALEEDPWIARTLAQGKESSDNKVNSYRLANIGGFEFSYMMGVITLCVVYAAIKLENKLLKIIFIVLSVVCFNFIISTMYTTLLLLTSIGTIILLFVNIKDKGFRLVLICVAILSLFFLDDLFKLLSTVFPEGSLLNIKFDNIYRSLVESDASELGTRPELMLESLSRWINNPIFGKYDINSFYAHSLIITTLEQTGIVGLSIIVFLFVTITKKLYKEMKAKNIPTSLFVISIIYLAFLSFLNPIGYCFEIMIAVFFVVPLVSELLANIEKEKD